MDDFLAARLAFFNPFRHQILSEDYKREYNRTNFIAENNCHRDYDSRKRYIVYLANKALILLKKIINHLYFGNKINFFKSYSSQDLSTT